MMNDAIDKGMTPKEPQALEYRRCCNQFDKPMKRIILKNIKNVKSLASCTEVL